MSFPIFWSVFPGDWHPGGQVECTPGVVGGKRNNRAGWVPGDHKHHSHLPIIINAMLGWLLNLHYTPPDTFTPAIHHWLGWGPLSLLSSLSLFSPLIVSCVYLPKHKRLILHCFSPLCQILIFTRWWSTESANNKHRTHIQKKKRKRRRGRQREDLSDVSVSVWVMRGDGCRVKGLGGTLRWEWN